MAVLFLLLVILFQCSFISAGRGDSCTGSGKQNGSGYNVGSAEFGGDNHDTHSQRKQFYVVSTHMTFIEATQHCQDKGDKLARLVNVEDNEAALAIIQSKLSSSEHFVWLGGYCPALVLQPMWLNPRTLMTFTYFHAGFPNIAGIDRCLEFWKIAGIWKWHENVCFLKRPFICEKTRGSGSSSSQRGTCS